LIQQKQIADMKKVFLFAALAFSINSYAQKVSSTPTFTKGQQLELVTKFNTVMSMEMMGQSMDTKIDATVSRNYDVQSVEGQKTKLEHKTKRVQTSIELPMSPAPRTFDSENAEDMNTEEGQATAKNLKNNYTIVLDANGHVSSVKANAENADASKVSNDDVMAGVSGVGALPEVGSSSELTVLPAGGVEKGTNWSDTTGGHKFNYTVNDITADEIVVGFTDQTTTNKKREANGMEFNLSTVDKTTGTIKVDRRTGILKERSSTTNSEGNLEIMGQTIPATAKTVVNIVVTSK
jgi:hypothetical protein